MVFACFYDKWSFRLLDDVPDQSGNALEKPTGTTVSKTRELDQFGKELEKLTEMGIKVFRTVEEFREERESAKHAQGTLFHLGFADLDLANNSKSFVRGAFKRDVDGYDDPEFFELGSRLVGKPLILVSGGGPQGIRETLGNRKILGVIKYPEEAEKLGVFVWEHDPSLVKKRLGEYLRTGEISHLSGFEGTSDCDINSVEFTAPLAALDILLQGYLAIRKPDALAVDGESLKSDGVLPKGILKEALDATGPARLYRPCPSRHSAVGFFQKGVIFDMQGKPDLLCECVKRHLRHGRSPSSCFRSPCLRG